MIIYKCKERKGKKDMKEKTNLQKCCDILLQVERIKEQTKNKYLISMLNNIFYNISKLLYLYKHNINTLEIERQQQLLDKITKRFIKRK